MFKRHISKITAVTGALLALGVTAYAADAALIQSPPSQPPVAATPAPAPAPATGPAAISAPSSAQTSAIAALGRPSNTSDQLPTSAASLVTGLGVGANPSLARQAYSGNGETAYVVPAGNGLVCLVVISAASGNTAGCSPASVAAQQGLYSTAPTGPGGAEDVIGVAPKGAISVTSTTPANQVNVTKVNSDGGYDLSTPEAPATLRQTWPDHIGTVTVPAPLGPPQASAVPAP